MPENKIKVEIITGRKILDVVPGYFRGSADRGILRGIVCYANTTSKEHTRKARRI